MLGFLGAYQLGHGSQQDLFQTAHSTFGRLTPPVHDYHRRDVTDSEAIPAYSSITSGGASQLMDTPTVDSSTLQQVSLVPNKEMFVIL